MNDSECLLISGKTPRTVIFANVERFGVQRFSDLIKVSSAHVSNVVQGNRDPSPTLLKNMRDHRCSFHIEEGLIPPPPKRTRVHVDLPSDYRKQVLQEGVKVLGFETWGEFVNSLGERWEELDKREKLDLISMVNMGFPWVE